MIRPQATVRRVGQRPTANPKSEMAMDRKFRIPGSKSKIRNRLTYGKLYIYERLTVRISGICSEFPLQSFRYTPICCILRITQEES